MNKIAIQHGVIIALSITIYNILLLLINPEYAFGYLAYLAVIMMIIGMVIALKKAKKEDDNYLSFKSAFSIIFVIALIVALGNIIYSNLIMPLILPNYVEVIKTVTLKSMDWWFDVFNAPQEARDQALDEVMKKFSKMNEVRIGDQIQAFLFTTLMNTFIGSIIALIIKSKGEKPKEMEAEVEHPVS